MSSSDAFARGGCHCGRVRFEVAARPEKVVVCNCSVCTKKAYLHWIVPRGVFRLLAGADDLVTYAFNTGAAKHLFCRVCGVAPYYVPRSDPDRIDVNVRCLDNVDAAALPVEEYDGRNWEAAYGRYRSSGGT
ncbi:GFA family protein [Candidatus Binatia bacterium]|nr:GFA family protein [Candidatus Binatia bacterium]